MPSLLVLAKRIAIVAVLATMVSTILYTFRESHIDLAAMRLMPLAMSLGLYALFCVLNANGWVLVLKVLGHPVSANRGIAVWVRSESFRWLPGSVWSFGVRSLEATRLGVPRRAGALSMALELSLTIVARLVFVGFAGMLFAKQIRGATGSALSLVLAAGFILALVLGWTFVSRLRSKAELKTMVESIKQTIFDPQRWRSNFGLFVYYLGLTFLQGVALQCLVWALVGDSSVSTLAMVGANSAAWLIGFFAIFAPGGLVVREGALAAALSTWLSAADGLSIAIAWRLLQIVVEFAMLIGVLWWHAPSPFGRDYLSAR